MMPVPDRTPVTTAGDPLGRFYDPIADAAALRNPWARALAVAEALDQLGMPEADRWASLAVELADRFPHLTRDTSAP